MNISSNTLFHYTRSLEALKNIITNGFEFRKIFEKIPVVLEDVTKNTELEISHTAVCFCDIPLSLTSDHIKEYGGYSIGLTKEWGISKAVTPVRYIHRTTPDTTNNILPIVFQKFYQRKLKNENIIQQLIGELINEKVITLEEWQNNKNIPRWCEVLFKTLSDIYVDLQNHIILQSAYYRVYEGSWTNRSDGKVQTKKFYNEREWRVLARGAKYLPFGLYDISKIIVADEAEVEPIAQTIIEKFKASKEDERKLLRKIYTHDDLFRDI